MSVRRNVLNEPNENWPANIAESAFDRSFHLDDQAQVSNARLTANNQAAGGRLGMKKKKPLYSHLHQPAVYQESKVPSFCLNIKPIRHSIIPSF